MLDYVVRRNGTMNERMFVTFKWCFSNFCLCVFQTSIFFWLVTQQVSGVFFVLFSSNLYFSVESLLLIKNAIPVRLKINISFMAWICSTCMVLFVISDLFSSNNLTGSITHPAWADRPNMVKAFLSFRQVHLLIQRKSKLDSFGLE